MEEYEIKNRLSPPPPPLLGGGGGKYKDKVHYNRVRVRPGLNRYLLSWQESPLPLSYWPNTANRTRIGTNRLEDEWTNQLSYGRFFFFRYKYNLLLYNISLIAYSYIKLPLASYYFRVTSYPLQLLPCLTHLLRKETVTFKNSAAFVIDGNS